MQFVVRVPVDLDNEDMVNRAKDAIIQDVTDMVIKGGTEALESCIEKDEDDSVGKSDIPDYLTGN